MTRAAIDSARSALLASGPEEFQPATVLFLLRECTAVTDVALRAAVERGLTRALQAAHVASDACDRIAWVRLLVEAASWTDDERVGETARGALPSAVDRLESWVRQTYEPGDGLVGLGCHDHLRGACALLDAWDLTGRLPYPMLAEELLRHAHRQWWDRSRGLFDGQPVASAAGLRATARLVRLHRDPGYRTAVAVGPTNGPFEDAVRLLTALEARIGRFPAEAAAVGPALAEWFALESDLQ